VPPTPDRPLTARFAAWDGSTVEDVVVRADGDGLTAEGRVVRAPDGAHDVHWVLRLDEAWRVRQLLLFRDLDAPDLWIGHDGGGGWGEINGAHRPDLDGCTDLDVAIAPFGVTVPIRRLGLNVGDAAELQVAVVDVETLGVTPQRYVLARLATRTWRLVVTARDVDVEFGIDEHGVVVDVDGFTRLT